MSETLSKPSGNWSSLPVRLASAVVIVVLVGACLWFGGWVWAIAIALLAARTGYEFARMSGLTRSGDTSPSWQLVAGPPLLLALAYVASRLELVSRPWLLGGAIAAILIAALMVELARSRRPRDWRVIGGVYVTLPLLAMVWLRNGGTGFDAPGFRIAAFLILVVIAADAGAYFAGKTIGGPKLAPKISPNKTWAGFAGGLVGGALMGAGLAVAFGTPPLRAALLALPIVAASVAGDFLESGFKRHFGVKDTGTILPGHGGVLDRIDSHMAAFTLAAAALALAPGLSPV